MSVRPVAAHASEARSRLDEVLAAGMQHVDIGVGLVAKEQRDKRAKAKLTSGDAKRQALFTKQRELAGAKARSPLTNLDGLVPLDVSVEIAYLIEAINFTEDIVLPATGVPEEMYVGVAIATNRFLEHIGVADPSEMREFYEAAKTLLLFMASEDYVSVYETGDFPPKAPDDDDALTKPPMDISGFFMEKEKGQRRRYGFDDKGMGSVMVGYFKSMFDFKEMVKDIGGTMESVGFFMTILPDMKLLFNSVLARWTELPAKVVEVLPVDAVEREFRAKFDDTYGSLKWFKKNVPDRLEPSVNDAMAKKTLVDWTKSIHLQKHQAGKDIRNFAADVIGPNQLFSVSGLKTFERMLADWAIDKLSTGVEAIIPPPVRIGYMLAMIFMRITTKILIFKVDTIAAWAKMNACKKGDTPDEPYTKSCAKWYADLSTRVDAAGRTGKLDAAGLLSAQRVINKEFPKWTRQYSRLKSLLRKKPRIKMAEQAITATAAGAVGGREVSNRLLSLVDSVGNARIFQALRTGVPLAVFSYVYAKWRNDVDKSLTSCSSAVFSLRKLDDELTEKDVPPLAGADAVEADDDDDENNSAEDKRTKALADADDAEFNWEPLVPQAMNNAGRPPLPPPLPMPNGGNFGADSEKEEEAPQEDDDF